jgi:hypothetical protein
VPQIATDTLCKFLLALDSGDVHAAYALVSTEFASGQSIDEFNGQLEHTSGQPAERYVMDVRSPGGVYVFSIQVFGGSRGYQEDVYIGVNQDIAKVVGLRIGPD